MGIALLVVLWVVGVVVAGWWRVRHGRKENSSRISHKWE